MPLVKMKQLLDSAFAGEYAVGAFSVGNMEMVMGVVRAAEETRSPLILQIAESRLGTSPLDLIAPIMLAAAQNASVPVAVHLDHGKTLPCIIHALELGFTSVMFDGSQLPIAENIAVTKQIRDIADNYGATVEAEIGCIGKTEEGGEAAVIVSDPKDAEAITAQASPDALAVAIGNAHGRYKGVPKLDFDVLAQIHSRLPDTPLVLHGGTGIADEQFRHAIASGIAKINIATSNFEYVTEEVKQNCGDYFAISKAIERGAYESAMRHIPVFGCAGKA